MIPIIIFFVGHWFLCVFCQTFFLHRYGAHSDVHDEQGLGALLPPAHVRLPGQLVPEPARLRDPAPRAPRVQRHAERPALAARLHERRDDDAGTRSSATTASAYGAIEPEPRFDGGYPGVAALDTLRPQLGRRASLFGAAYTAFYVRVRAALVDVPALAGPLHHGPDPRRDRELVRPQVRLPQLRHDADDSRATRWSSTSSRWASSSRTTTTSSACRRTSRRAGSRSTRPTRSFALLAWLKIIDLGPAPQWARYPARDVDAIA